MLFLFQTLFTIFALLAIIAVISKRREGLLGVKGMWFWIVFWLAAVVVVLWPNSTVIIANTLGIGRGADLVLYISVAVLFYLLFKLHIKVEGLSRDLTKVVRREALEGNPKFEILNPKQIQIKKFK